MCGLKLEDEVEDEKQASVTPFVGVWIETPCRGQEQRHVFVTPFVGVWIETQGATLFTLHSSWSHPSWVCGLKHLLAGSATGIGTSHPSWVSGLKLTRLSDMKISQSHTLRGCVD